MKPQSRIAQRSLIAFISMSGLAAVLGLTASRAQADEWDKKTILTIDEPMQVSDTLLQPGQYVFKLLDSQSDRHIVEIYNAEQTHLITTVMAIPNYRIQPTGKSRFMMWETPAGNPRALRAWFYPGDNFGQEFPYPKHSEQTSLTQTASNTPAPPTQPPDAEPAIEPQPVTAQPEVAERQEVVIAQNTPPPPAVTQDSDQQSVSVQPPARSVPAELPKTASPYPLFGFAGLIFLGLGGLLRQTTSS
jgi:hypothetical protein